ncbi:MAG: sensory transduction histidine kinase [Clostridiales bacterium]|jgi:signal transduction histidine kinase|nr:sensory transduction histidine kinase [Clostridiales bacterium]
MTKKLFKVNIITATIIVVVLLTSVFWSTYLFKEADLNLYDNQIRILVSKQKSEIEKGIYETGKYPYIVFELDGNVLYCEKPFEAYIGDSINVQEMLQFDRSFYIKNNNLVKESFVLEKNKITNGFVTFLVPQNEVMMKTQVEQVYEVFLPIIIGMIICIILTFIRTVYCNKCILTPLREISESAKGIIAGNYNLEVVRIYGRRVRENEVGELTYSFEIMRDELKEKQLREESLKKSQQELISCISHDLKTPISTIKAYSEALRDHIAKNPHKQEEYVNIIINKTDLLIGMIDELLKCSNAELKQLDINCKETYFIKYFEPLMKELNNYITQKSIGFSYEINCSEALVNIDKKRISEVMYNLVENSMKYMGDKVGQITITAEKIDREILVKVKDNGIGISSNDIPYLFDKFYRAEKSRSSSVPGSGLGLSICKYIINEHGGEIYCKSRQNEGCEIGFTLGL